ncbi:MAG: hypothetical protein OEW15_00200 [Nitrospirota bacterium]|nr:hypothetical protein [Nitrospirota bacterium]
MPKIIYIHIVIAFVALGLLLGCGSGDKGPVGRVAPQELVSGASGTGDGLGGGGGGTGACVAQGACVNNMDAGTCVNNGGQFYNGTTCQNLGFTNCQNVQGTVVCF